ncbi:hypothetical protein GCM10009740_39540 [Terrabacter terrae]|uniref:HNH endonuclease n=1 Tax=Terrabacter terrae TaxID=318434 RepID=A0ABP4KIP1_9MICO
MDLHQVEVVAPGLAARIAGAERGQARRFAFRVARLACSVADLHDATALEVARGGLEHYPEIEELMHLWELERELEAACAASIGGDPRTVEIGELRLHSDCAKARAVAAVIAALRPDALVAARDATREAFAAGCDQHVLEDLAGELL